MIIPGRKIKAQAASEAVSALAPFKSAPMFGKDCLLYFLPSFHSWSFSPYVHLSGFPLCVVFSLEAMSPRDIGLQQNLWSMMNEQ